jgi:hypothetical protein
MASGEVPSDDFAERVRGSLSSRRQGLEECCHEALDVAAAFLVVLHRGMVGRQEALRGDQSGSFFRRRLRGDDPLAVEDLARLAIEAPTALGPALAVLAHRAGYQLEPASPLASTLPAAAVSFTESFAAVSAAERLASADGRVEPHEIDDIERQIDQHERRTATLKGTLASLRRSAR